MSEAVRVFLCSTYEDLVDERKAVLASLSELKLVHESMEFFGARPSPAIETCLAEVMKSNVLILVVGHRYGSIVPGQNVSFTEAEYREGVRLNRPCLVYMRRDDVAVLPRFFESDPEKLAALGTFRKILNERHTVARFRTPEDLAEEVRSNIRETVQAVEAQAQNARNSDEAFFAELQELARSALANGHKEALLLSAFRTAVSSLDVQRPTLVQQIVGATRSILAWRPVPSRVAGANWVFFSYAQADLPVVAPVATELKKYGLRVWLDQQQLVPGDLLVEGIKEGLHKAKALVFFASRNSLKSQWARHELDYFMAQRVTSGTGPILIPVILEDVELPGVLRDVLYLDLRRGGARDAAKRIAAAVRGRS
jgi:TIR domain/Domain of unknown function (DUF4062)